MLTSSAAAGPTLLAGSLPFGKNARSGHSDVGTMRPDRCEETNPGGGCCLESVAKAVNHSVGLKEQGLL